MKMLIVMKKALKNRIIRWLLVYPVVLIIIIFTYLLIYHLPEFPFLYLTDKREAEIKEFTEYLLKKYKDELIIKVYSNELIFSYPPGLTEVQVSEEIRFMNKNDFHLLFVRRDYNTVEYVHFFLRCGMRYTCEEISYKSEQNGEKSEGHKYEIDYYNELIFL